MGETKEKEYEYYPVNQAYLIIEKDIWILTGDFYAH